MRSVINGQHMRTLSALCTSVFLVTAVAATTGCDEKKPDAAPAASAKAVPSTPAVTASAAAPSTPAATASAAPEKTKSFAEKLKCDTLLPEKARQAGFLNYKLTQQVTCAECGPTCSMVRPDQPFAGLAVSYTCNAAYDKAAADKKLAETKKALAKPVTLAMGRGGVMGEKDNGTFYTAVAYDDDSDCKVVVDWMRGDKKGMEPLVKMALANVKQSDVDAAKK